MTELRIDNDNLAQSMLTRADAAVVADPDGIDVYWNVAAEQDFRRRLHEVDRR